MKLREAQVTTWAAAGTTLGAVTLFGVIATGSAANGAVNISDGTALKYVVPVGATATQPGGFMSPVGVAFANLIVSVVSTAGYSLTYRPRP